ncbi:hypothetical protein VNO77_44626 [Canavalia gladiata]|uniref:Uncharacterized protein n=1 Tax=Canavalia gladiata TaxID=3824 RepID=A0AAN9JYF4_CANGL
MPRKAKRSRKRPSRGISNLMVHASSEGHSISMEPPLQPSKLAEPSMPHKTKRTTKRVRRVTHNLISHASSQGHSASMEPPLQHSEMAQPCAPTITIIPPLLPTTQNTVSPLDPSSHTLSRKVKLSKKRVTFGTSNSVPHASSQKYSVLMEPPVQPSELAQPCAPNSTLIPPSIPIAQDPILLSDPPSRAKPRKTKYSNKRVHHGTSNLMPHTSSQGHSTPVETLPKSCTPAITFVPSSIPTAHNLVSPSAAPSSMPRKAKLSRELASLGISNFMPRASSQGHSTYMETLQPSLVAQSCAPSIAPTPPSIATVQSVVSPLDQPLRTMPRRGKLSRERASLGISNMMPNASSHGHSPHMVETPPQPSQVAQSCAPTTTLVPSSSPTAQNLVSPSDPLLHTVPSKNVFSGILNLMHRASYQGQSIPVESSQQSSKPAQTCAPTTTDTLPSIPTAEDLVSPLDLPSCLRPCKSKHFKKRVLRGISNLMLHPSSQGHSIPMEPPLQPLELPRSCAPLIALIPSSSPIGQDPASSSPSDPSQDPVSSSPSDPSQDLVSGSPSDQTQDLVSGSPSDPPTHSISHTFVSPSTITQQALAPNFHPHAGRQWTVQAIDEHGNSKKIQVTKPGVFGMPPGQRIIVPFDRQLRAFGEASTLLSAACGRIVTDSKNIPINFDSWPKVPKSYKDDCFNILKVYP